MTLVTVAGAFGYKPFFIPQTWDDPQSAWWTARRRQGFEPALVRPYVYPADIDGIGPFHPRWMAAGDTLAALLEHVPYEDRNVVSLSHGLQPVLYACGQFGLELRTFTDICGPVRYDLYPLAAEARRRIGYWQHVWTSPDWWQWLGSLFDGSWKYQQEHPSAHVSRYFAGIGHTGLVYEAKWLDGPVWDALAVGIHTGTEKVIDSGRPQA